jgi:23S rRNA (guanine745-N1)-methyltransferase
VLEDAIGLLRCPHCGEGLGLDGGAAVCVQGHSFDVARQGYLNLLPGDTRTGTADTAAMVAARERFLATGHYAPLADAVVDACVRAVGGGKGCVADVGAGTGHYLAAALERLPDRVGVALDISKPALRRAARAHPRIGAVGCDAWRELPLRGAVAAVALSVFAPRDIAELARVLEPGGALVVASPTDRHLAELVAAVGMLTVRERKREGLAGRLGAGFEAVAEASSEWTLELGRDDLAALVGMGPSAHHLTEDEIAERVGELTEPFEVTASVTVSTYRRAG